MSEDQGIVVYPFLFTAEDGDLACAARRPVPFTELLAVHTENRLPQQRTAGRV